MVNLPLLGWGLETAYTYRDANIDNTAVIAQFLGMDLARSMDEFQAVFENVQGLPWVNTLAADRTGRAWYIDGSATPNISDAAQRRYRERVATDPVAAILLENRVALLDGSDPDDDWIDDPAARSRGLVAYSRQPQVERRDFVLNANDSHWLPNPATPLEGYSVLHGFERTPLSLRTRQNLAVAQHLADTGGLTTESVLAAVLDNAGLSAELLATDVAERAQSAGSVAIDGGAVDLGPAARVLTEWDGRADLGSVGAALWREFVASFPLAAQRDAGDLFATPFDPDQPATTPRDLAPPPAEGPDPVAEGLGRAMVSLERAGIAVETPLGEVQWADRGAHRVPVHRGGEGEGILNVVVPEGLLPRSSIEPGLPPLEAHPGRTARTGLTTGGYRCTYGTSFLMAVELTDDGPRGIGLMTYGQSGDTRSPRHVDGTRAFSAKHLRLLRFTDAEIEADPDLTRRTISSD
jgi:acyl-homoserine-lactone acylase